MNEIQEIFERLIKDTQELSYRLSEEAKYLEGQIYLLEEEKIMKSPYETKNYFYLHGIPFLPLQTHGGAVFCRIGHGKQKVFIPRAYFDVDKEEGIKLKENVDLEWFWNKKRTQCNIRNYLAENKSEVESNE